MDRFVEAGACGTAAVISPIGGIQHGDDFHVFYSETEVGPVTRKLYDELTGIQFGDVEAVSYTHLISEARFSFLETVTGLLDYTLHCRYQMCIRDRSWNWDGSPTFHVG